MLLSFLRFIALFCTFLLLINPKFSKNTYSIEKPNLILLVDNSSSIATAGDTTLLKNAIATLKGNTKLQDQFNVEQYHFGADINATDRIDFTAKNTNISAALRATNAIYKNAKGVVVLLTDGNQTLGEDYEFYGRNQDFPVYPVSIGDSTRYDDLRVGQVNTNTYAFVDNKYPLEAYITYEGAASVNTTVQIQVNGNTVLRKNLAFSSENNSRLVSTLLNANTVGIKTIKVVVTPIEQERNIVNNQKEVAVEVIDEKTNIALISAITHPDLGALKKAIERNEQRKVTVYKPNVALNKLEDVNLFILYQPVPSFKKIYNFIQQKKGNTFTITGRKTDWNFLNSIQNSFKKDSYGQQEELSPTVNPSFSIFNNADFAITDFPPLKGNLGEITLNKSNEVLLSQRVKGVTLKEPLFSVFNNETEKEAVLFGEDIWKWRVQSYRNDNNFINFDGFIGKLMRYLATDKPKTRLTMDYESVYSGSSNAVISASYFDKAFVFDSNASLTVLVTGITNEIKRELPMLLKGGYYETDLSVLPAGRYNFTATVANEKLSKSGSFTILDFDVEQQFLSANYKKLQRLATATQGALHFADKTGVLIEQLLQDKRFTPTQKSKQNIVSLIDFKVLLGIIIIALALEWFIRKYIGLI